MPPAEILTLEIVCSALRDWKRVALSDEQMHFWATNNYFSVHQVVAPYEPDHIALAIGIVLTEFEFIKPPSKFTKAFVASAPAVTDTGTNEFESIKAIFFDSLRLYKHAL